ncbi:hypothetical protein M0R45_028158 [Rubus argutus]|uniref:PHD-type domain-containing protein n=1 Tax=Rubus argutus TaxID=59490 RepID=A0AAW1W4A5_RUBAR
MVSNICLTCGSGAFKEVLVYCDKCKEYAQHAYCLDASEEYFYTWYCEDCEEQMKSDTSISTHDLDDCESMDTEELLQISTSDSAGTSITPANGASKNLNVKKTKKLKKESKKKKISRSESVAKRVLETILEGNEEAEGNEVDCDQEGHVLEEEKFNASDNVVPISPDDPLEIPEDGHSTRVAAKPVAVPTWRGSLNIVNKVDKVDYINLRNVTVSGLVAHLSSLACPKVLEEAKFLKTHLEPDLVRRTDVWPKGYDMCETRPSDRSIALYIFPDKKIDQKGFDNFVVSMKQEDLAMRIEIENAELLLFTSQLLPEQYRRFKTKMYLWGVFKEKY